MIRFIIHKFEILLIIVCEKYWTVNTVKNAYYCKKYIAVIVTTFSQHRSYTRGHNLLIKLQFLP